jgi:hypothetical protein
VPKITAESAKENGLQKEKHQQLLTGIAFGNEVNQYN